MVKELQVTVPPQVAFNDSDLRTFLLGEKAEGVVRVLKRSIDARGREVKVHLHVRLYINELPTDTLFTPIEYRALSSSAPQAIIVGAGPAGLFAALRCIEHGTRPIVVERGKDVHARRKDIAQISRTGRVDDNSNYGFGEGGAGAFSDGKLFTRSKKRGNSNRVLQILVQHGASEQILIDAHPHIGTDKLPRVIENIRNTIIRCGGEVHFNTRMTELLFDRRQTKGIRTADGREFSGEVILATGHSARDVYRYIKEASIATEAKGIAVGVRIEHPQELIDRLMYHSQDGRGEWLPPAEYNMVMQSSGRGVYSFCMCPGGTIVPAATGSEQVVVNGMSSSTRGGRWANSGMVVQVQPEDVASMGYDDALSMQIGMERRAWLAGKQSQVAPAQRAIDFCENRQSLSLPNTSYSAGVAAVSLNTVLPPFVANRLRDGLQAFGRKYKGFLSEEALLIGVETRTSAPLRIPRRSDTLQHIEVGGLYPCGEGAGYAGGIVSAAVDGERCADALCLS